MKAKSLLSIFSALLLVGLSAKAQDLDDVYIDDNATGSPVVNNYYGDYDFYYTSRIFRFHRPYVAFNYYSPFFTDTYWYTYQPFNLGISIYGGFFGLSLGCNFSFPVYYYNDYYPNYYYSSWNDPFFYGSGYWGYRPFYSNYWYSPGFLNPFTWNRWNYHNHSWDWRGGYQYNDSFNGDNRNDYYSSNRRQGSGSDRLYRQSGLSDHNSPGYENRRIGDGPVYSRNSAAGGNRYTNTPDSRYNNRKMINNTREISNISERNHSQSSVRSETGSFANRVTGERRNTGSGTPLSRTENRMNSGSLRHSGQQIPAVRNSSVSNNLRRNAAVKQATAIKNNHDQIRRSNSVRNNMLADAASSNSSRIMSGTYRNNNLNRSTVSNSRSADAIRVNRERNSMPAGNISRTNVANGKRNFNFSGESPAARHSFQGSVRNARQTRPLSSVQNRSFSEGRRGNISGQSHSVRRSGASGEHFARSNSGQHGRRR
jgi:hypothetical protein